jgi:hypothetical protein
MNFEDAAKQINPDIYLRFKEALTLGKWPDGRMLTREQKEICLQAVMLYEAEHDIPEQERVGFIDRDKKKNSGDDAEPVRVLH